MEQITYKIDQFEGPLDLLLTLITKNKIDIAVLTLPKLEAPAVAELLAKAGIRGFWNFSNMELHLPEYNVKIENIHLGDTLMTLCYELAKQDSDLENITE